VPVFIWIPWGIKHTAAISGSVTRDVTCMECGTVYYYTLTRRATGSRTAFILGNQRPAENTAAQEARANLRHQLRGAVDPVACPTCGYFQPSMVRAIRRRRQTIALGTGLVVGLYLLLFPFTSPRWPASLAVIIGSTLVAVGWCAISPNRSSRRQRNRDNTRGLTMEGISSVREQQRQRQAELEKRQLADSEQSWNCPKCSCRNPNARYSCRSCGYSLV